MPTKQNALLVTGSHGFVGAHYLQTRQTEFDQIWQLDRAARRSETTLNVDLRDPNLEAKLPEGINVLVHSAAALPSHTQQEIFDTDVRATFRLLRWAQRSGVRQVIYISSTAVYGPKHAQRVTEDTPPKAWDAYNSAKIRAEALVATALRQSDVNWTILRPKAIVGPGRMGLFGHLFDFAQSGKGFPVIGSGNAVYQFLHVDDLTQAIDRCIAHPHEANGRTFNIASNADHSIAQLFQSVLDQAGHGAKVLQVPEALARTVLGAAHTLGLSPVYSRLIENLVHGSTVSLDAARDCIGYLPNHNGLSAMRDSYSWYRENHRSSALVGKGHRQIWRSPLAAIVKKVI